jgi:dTDP-4-amino-4,6-dideoxygalactose transaminase
MRRFRRAGHYYKRAELMRKNTINEWIQNLPVANSIPVHLYGQPSDVEPVIAIARKHNFWIIEDCAQAHLACYKGSPVGTFGDAATFSFYPGKNLGAYGDAGCLVTNDDKLADWTATYARHGGKAEHIMEGINSSLDGLQAAILLVKLPHLRARKPGVSLLRVTMTFCATSETLSRPSWHPIATREALPKADRTCGGQRRSVATSVSARMQPFCPSRFATELWSAQEPW